MNEQELVESEFRYEERVDEYRLRRWCNGLEFATAGPIANRPEWLAAIVNAALVGGHMKRTYEPPPDCIVWFVTDANYNLLRFLELG